LQSAGDVGIRSRGRGSRSPDKPNLDVNMDKFVKKQRFTGLGFFVLKANNQDSSLMHEALAFELFRKMGLPGPREAPARLYVNGEYFGFCTSVEHVDEDFINRNLGERGGELFEWKPNAIYNFEDLGDDPAPYAALLEPKTNEDVEYRTFIDMVKAINYSPDTDFVNAVSRYLDLNLLSGARGGRGRAGRDRRNMEQHFRDEQYLSLSLPGAG
jgi:spore coat protein CotH